MNHTALDRLFQIQTVQLWPSLPRVLGIGSVVHIRHRTLTCFSVQNADRVRPGCRSGDTTTKQHTQVRIPIGRVHTDSASPVAIFRPQSMSSPREEVLTSVLIPDIAHCAQKSPARSGALWLRRSSVFDYSVISSSTEVALSAFCFTSLLACVLHHFTQFSYCSGVRTSLTLAS